jgi:hypothetical protein
MLAAEWPVAELPRRPKLGPEPLRGELPVRAKFWRPERPCFLSRRQMAALLPQREKAWS